MDKRLNGQRVVLNQTITWDPPRSNFLKKEQKLLRASDLTQQGRCEELVSATGRMIY